ncbi:3'-5' exoribonuclease 1 [Nowakowskiella sp. JEL0078]|nr:3'-5' exoribonuclease 1 [Nowakowskiella sp. JEL0078]
MQTKSSNFHYVLPTVNPQLSEFCIELTGIQQSQIDEAEPFFQVLCRMEEWLSTYSTPPFIDVMFITDGPWDLRDFLRKQCQSSRIPRPLYTRKFIDIRRLFMGHYDCKRQNLVGMLEYLGMTFNGREHSGIDDTRNIARIVICLMREGVLFHENSVISSNKRVKRRGR